MTIMIIIAVFLLLILIRITLTSLLMIIWALHSPPLRHQPRRCPGLGRTGACIPVSFLIWEFSKIRGTSYFGVLIIRILLFRDYIGVPYFRKPRYYSSYLMGHAELVLCVWNPLLITTMRLLLLLLPPLLLPATTQ